MATTINKQRVVTHLLEAFSKPTESEPDPLPVLEQFIYGLCREDSTPEQAGRAFKTLKSRFFDWNEVRVSSVREIEDALAGLSNAESRAQRLLSFLQEVFEATFSFDLDGLTKKALKQAAKQLTRYQAADEYIGAWVVQRTLGGHSVPVDQATMRVCRRLHLIGEEDAEGARSHLEHLVPKAKGAAFTDGVSVLAEDFCWESSPCCATCPLNADCPSSQVGTESATRAHRVRSR